MAYRSILLPVDGSHLAESAFPLATTIAGKSGARVRLVLVHVPALVAYADAEGLSNPIADLNLDDRARKNDLNYLAQAEKDLSAALPGRVDSAMLEGQVTKALLSFAKSQRADLVVMATHGRGGFSRFWLGSVANELIRQSPVPVLLQRTEEGKDAPYGGAVHEIAVPLDGSRLSEGVISEASKLAKLLGARIRFLRVVVHPPFEDRRLVEELTADAQAYLRRHVQRLQDRGLDAKSEVLVSVSPAQAILDYSREQNVGMIAMATHGRGGLPRVVLGSIADKVIRGSSGPVLIYHPPHNPRGNRAKDSGKGRKAGGFRRRG